MRLQYYIERTNVRYAQNPVVVEGGEKETAFVRTIKSRGDKLGAWRLAASGSRDASGDTGNLSVRRPTGHGDRGLLRWVAGDILPFMGRAQRLATLHTGDAGGIFLRPRRIFLRFFRRKEQF